MFQKWKIKVDAETIHKDQWNQIDRPRALVVLKGTWRTAWSVAARYRIMKK